MEDFHENMTIRISGKTRYAMLAFLRKHGGDKDDMSSFIEDAIRWYMLDRELALHHASDEEKTKVFDNPTNGLNEAEAIAS